jgi:hypothetical protein
MNEKATLPRTVRGKRPRFYDTPGIDELMSITLALTQELSVLRDRVDAAERVMAKQGTDLASEIEALELDEGALKSREAARNALFDRVFFIFAQQRAELEDHDGSDTYEQTLEKIARGEI